MLSAPADARLSKQDGSRQGSASATRLRRSEPTRRPISAPRPTSDQSTRRELPPADLPTCGWGWLGRLDRPEPTVECIGWTPGGFEGTLIIRRSHQGVCIMAVLKLSAAVAAVSACVALATVVRASASPRPTIKAAPNPTTAGDPVVIYGRAPAGARVVLWHRIKPARHFTPVS